MTITEWTDEEIDYLFWRDQWMGHLPMMTMGYGPQEPPLHGPSFPSSITEMDINDPNSF